MAKRLIDADALKCRFLAFMTGAHTTYLEDHNITMMVNQAPTVDAADRLEALLAENERLKAGKDTNVPTKWVSVDERLPELNVMVVGITKDNPFSRYVPQVVHRNEHGWVFTYSMRYVTDVTHWMPLPSTEGVE